MKCNLKIQNYISPKDIRNRLNDLFQYWNISLDLIDYIKSNNRIGFSPPQILLMGSIAEHLIDYFCFNNAAKTGFDGINRDIDFVGFKNNKAILNLLFLGDNIIHGVHIHHVPDFFVKNKIFYYGIISSSRECVVNINTGECFYSECFIDTVLNKIIHPPEIWEDYKNKAIKYRIENFLYFLFKLKDGYSISKETYDYIFELLDCFVRIMSVQKAAIWCNLQIDTGKIKISKEDILEFIDLIYKNSNDTNRSKMSMYHAELKKEIDKGDCQWDNLSYFLMSEFSNFRHLDKEYNIEIIGKKQYINWKNKQKEIVGNVL